MNFNKKIVLLARGGDRGLGNNNFKSSINRAQKYRTLGKKGEKKYIKLELNLISDICVIGFPNSGKSTFVKKFTGLNQKIGLYPFTTLYPNTGNMKFNNFDNF